MNQILACSNCAQTARRAHPRPGSGGHRYERSRRDSTERFRKRDL